MTFIETVVVIGGVIGGLLTSLCWNIRRSRCEKIETPCLLCMRKVMTEKEMRFDTINSQPDTPKMTRADSDSDYNKAT